MVPADTIDGLGTGAGGALAVLARACASLLSSDFLCCRTACDLTTVADFSVGGFGLAGLADLAKASSAKAFVTR